MRGANRQSYERSRYLRTRPHSEWLINLGNLPTRPAGCKDSSLKPRIVRQVVSSSRRAIVLFSQVLLVLLASFGLSSCGASSSLRSVQAASGSVTINPSSITVGAGQKQQLIATVSTSSGNNAVIWSL